MSFYKKFLLPRLLDRFMSRAAHENERRAVIREVKGVVLEIGFGSGLNLPFYGNISRLYALEPSRELVEMAKARISSTAFPVEFMHIGAENIPLQDSSVDTVVSTWTLCSVADPKQVLAEIARVLRPGGRFIFIDHGASPKRFISLLQKVLTPFTKALVGNCHLDRNIEGVIREAGFQIAAMEHPQEHYKPLVYNYKGIAVKK